MKENRKYDYFHNYFLNLGIKRTEAIETFSKQYKKVKENHLQKILDMLKLFEAPEENISYIKDNFYSKDIFNSY